MTGTHYPNLLLILLLQMNLKCCWTDTIVIVYLIMYNIYITITIIYVIFWMYRHKPLSLYLQLKL